MSKSWLADYFKETVQVVQQLDLAKVDALVERLVRLRTEKGRLFLCGVGGSAGNCSHAVNDFRKIVGIEAYAATDNVSEL
ncbi:MAG TPA: sugar isomerase, partial [Terriglobia bacterium]|nr:sugar isomerase [Terriglobia bacterium]